HLESVVIQARRTSLARPPPLVFFTPHRINNEPTELARLVRKTGREQSLPSNSTTTDADPPPTPPNLFRRDDAPKRPRRDPPLRRRAVGLGLRPLLLLLLLPSFLVPPPAIALPPPRRHVRPALQPRRIPPLEEGSRRRRPRRVRGLEDPPNRQDLRVDGIFPHGGGEANPTRVVHRGVRDGGRDDGDGDARGRGAGDDPHDELDPRRPAQHGQRRLEEGEADEPRDLRRGRGHPRGRRPPQHVLRARRARDEGRVPRARPRRRRPPREVRRRRGPRGRTGHGPRVRGQARHDPRRPEVDPHPQDRDAPPGRRGLRGRAGRSEPGGGGRVREVRDGRRPRVPGGRRHPRRDAEQRGAGEDGREGRGHGQDDVREAHGVGGEQEVRAGADRRGEGVPGAVRGAGRAAAGDRGLHSRSGKLERGGGGASGEMECDADRTGKRTDWGGGGGGGGIEDGLHYRGIWW
ncbi:hypothetical protein ACHAWF_010713, partial [Thalassiosira exigua]